MAARECGDDKESSYVLAVDIGTTTITCHVYDKMTTVLGSSCKPIQLLHPKPGFSEIDPDFLMLQFTAVIKEAIRDSKLTASQMTCLGIATQRNTFILWDKETGQHFHNFITWQDLRATSYCKSWNTSYSLRGLHAGSSILHFFSRQKRFLAGSILTFRSQMIPMRLMYMIDHCPGVRECLQQEKLLFGNIDTWLLWKLTGGQVFATDFSNASCTAMYDSFQLTWSNIMQHILGIPLRKIAPEVRDTSGYFACCQKEYFGHDIPIRAIVADQQSAMFAQCCFEPGDVKVTMGTGSFININTGKKAHASIAGLYPLVGWKIGEEVVYLAEGNANDAGSAIEWAKSLDLFDTVTNTADIAQSVPDSGGVYFVPAFSGIQAPINDETAVTSMIGMSPNTTKAHIVRAILESIAFRVKLLYETVVSETKFQIPGIRIDGGISRNDFVMQLIADITNQRVERTGHSDMTCLGAAFLAGLSAGIWKSKDELKTLRKVDKVFEPRNNWSHYKPIIQQWERALRRSLGWYQTDRDQQGVGSIEKAL